MSTLDEITKEKQRISEALARVDMQRDKLASQLGELEATERVLARYSKGTEIKKTTSARAPTTATKAAAPARRHGRPPTTTEKAVGRKRSSSNLGDQIRVCEIAECIQEVDEPGDVLPVKGMRVEVVSADGEVIAKALPEGGEQNAPLGRAVIGGLLCATFATLVFVPSVFALLHKKTEVEPAQQGQPEAASAH